MKIIEHNNVILSEKDPLLREIWANGYTYVVVDEPSWEIRLIKKSKQYEKIICMHNYKKVVSELTFMRGSNLTGSVHTWITEKDGSADKFRELIK